jgi:hypothetical protein
MSDRGLCQLPTVEQCRSYAARFKAFAKGVGPFAPPIYGAFEYLTQLDSARAPARVLGHYRQRGRKVRPPQLAACLLKRLTVC